MDERNTPAGLEVSIISIGMDEAMQSPPEADTTVARAQAGDTKAFEQLYREHVGHVHALCLRMVRNKTVADDLTQEAFLRAWHKLHSFRGDSAFATWLHRLTVNLVLTHLRSDARRNERVTYADRLESYETPQNARPTASGVDLEAAIAELPERARAVFILHEIEGYRHDEIAGIMGIAAGTAKAQLHRARRMLREALA
jgi:RNA polymerase sigma-70 factor, ECF subfamily